MNTIHHLSQYALQELKDSYSEHEIECICKIIYMDVLHYTNIDIHLRKNEILDESFINKFIGIVRLLKSGANLGMDYRPGDRSVGRFPFLSLFRCELPEK